MSFESTLFPRQRIKAQPVNLRIDTRIIGNGEEVTGSERNVHAVEHILEGEPLLGQVVTDDQILQAQEGRILEQVSIKLELVSLSPCRVFGVGVLGSPEVLLGASVNVYFNKYALLCL